MIRSKPQRLIWLVLVAITAVAFILRLGFIYLTGMAGRVVNADGHTYGLIATNLLSGHGFALQPGLPTAQRPFAYPWLLAGIFSISGISVLAVQWVQVLLGSLVVLPTGAVAYRLGGPAVAVLAGLALRARPPAPVTWLLLVPVAAWIVKTVVFYGSARQSALVLPALCAFVGLALGQAWKVMVETHRL